VRFLLTAAAVVFIAAQARAGSGEGASSAGDDGVELEGWIALGAAAVVAGILIWDVMSDSGGESAPSDSAAAAVVPTGIEWTSLRPLRDGATVVGVSVFPGDDGWNLAQYFQQLLLPLEDRGYLFAGDPMNLGPLEARQQAALAGDFFECTWFVAALDSSLELLDVEGRRIWSFPVAGWDSAGTRSAALDLMGSVSGI
jgi:hypothetical protein